MESDWLDACFTAARPRAVAALTRALRDIDLAEEAYQEACLRALAHWSEHGPPRDPTGWLIFVGRNYGIDEIRRRSRQAPPPDDSLMSDDEDVEARLVETLDTGDYRDDILRLLFICAHPDLPAAQQVALALRVVAGLSVDEIASAFLVAPGAMEQRLTRAKRRVAAADVSFAPPGAVERAERLGAVAAMIYLMFNEGYSASRGEAHIRAPLCEEAIRLARILLRLYPAEPEVMGLVALCLLQHARRDARLDGAGDIVLLEAQDRARWDRALIAEGLVLVEKALRQGRPGAYQIQAAIAAMHSRARRAEETDWAEIERLYRVLEKIQPSAVVTLNRAVAVARAFGAADALGLIEPLADDLGAYFHFHGVRGALLAEIGEEEQALQAFERAVALARTPAEAAHIRRHLDRLKKI